MQHCFIAIALSKCFSSDSDPLICESCDQPGAETSLIPSKTTQTIDEEELDTNIRKLFALIDVNGNGYINLREFERHLAVSGIRLDREVVEQIYSLILLAADPAPGTVAASASYTHLRDNL